MINNGEVIEWGKHKGHYYGTQKIDPREISRKRKQDRNATFRVCIATCILAATLQLLTLPWMTTLVIKFTSLMAFSFTESH